MADSRFWQTSMAPTLGDIEALAMAAWDRLPSEFRALAQDVVIRVVDFAPDEVLEELAIESPYDLMGLYQGVALTQKGVLDPPREPDMIFLYRRALLDFWTEGEETLGQLVTHVLVHEIGHHFGLSDDDMEAIEADVLD
jgi:predicted Zn-dependent protease with MMP-like domain